MKTAEIYFVSDIIYECDETENLDIVQTTFDTSKEKAFKILLYYLPSSGNNYTKKPKTSKPSYWSGLQHCKCVNQHQILFDSTAYEIIYIIFQPLNTP